MKKGIYVDSNDTFYYLYYVSNAPSRELDTLLSKLMTRGIIKLANGGSLPYEIKSLKSAKKDNDKMEVVFYTPRDRLHYETNNNEDTIEW